MLLKTSEGCEQNKKKKNIYWCDIVIKNLVIRKKLNISQKHFTSEHRKYGSYKLLCDNVLLPTNRNITRTSLIKHRNASLINITGQKKHQQDL